MRRSQPWLTNRSRSLRSKPISAEQALWRQLRNRKLRGYKFVRQEPIGPFFVDFVCRERKLVVEVDGGTHSTTEELHADGRRSEYLAATGYRMVRVGNRDIFENMEGALDMILAEIESLG